MLLDRRIRERPGFFHLRQEIDRGGFDALRLDEIDVVALLHAADRALARIFIGVPAQEVVEQTFAHRAIGHAHGFDAELLEHFGQDRHAPGERKLAIFRDRIELQVADVLEPAEFMNDAFEAVGADVDRGGIELADGVADGAHGARTSHGLVESAAAERRLVRLDGLARRDPRALHALLRESAVGEKFFAQAHAAYLQALELQRLQPLTDDDLRAAAADVADQAAPGTRCHRVRHAGIDEARLFDAGDDFDGMPDGFARALDERFLLLCAPENVGAHHAHAVGPHVAQALAESFEAGERAGRDILVQSPIGFEAGAEAHHLAEPIDNDQLAVRVTRDHHVKTVGTEIDRSKYVGDGLRSAPRHV